MKGENVAHFSLSFSHSMLKTVPDIIENFMIIRPEWKLQPLKQTWKHG